MNSNDWLPLIDELCSWFPLERRCPPASEAVIREAERRLGTRLPTSFRTFLSVSNGFRHVLNEGHVLPADRLTWLRASDPELVDVWTRESAGVRELDDASYLVYGPNQDPSMFRPRYLNSALKITDMGDDGVWLLNPEIRTANGEWEAWHFAHYYPGARRFPSFPELVEQRLREERQSLGNR